MSALLWKEWQERRYWLLLFALAEVGTGVFTPAQSPFGWGQNTSGWGLLPVAVALLAGLGAYGSELTGGRATFLYSRAICWKQVLFAKLLLGVSVLAAAPVLTALILRLKAPAPYLPFMTPAHLLFGALWVILLTGTAFCVGLGCSIVLTGLAGSILVLLGYIGICFLLYALLPYGVNLTGNQAFFLSIGCCYAPMLPAVVIARFGITLSPGERLCRSALLLPIPLIAGFLLASLPQAAKFGADPAQTAYNFAASPLSPSGVYAYAEWSGKDGRQHNYLVDIANKRCLLAPSNLVSLGQAYAAWSPNDCLIAQAMHPTKNTNGTVTAVPSDYTFIWLQHGQLRSRSFTSAQLSYNQADPRASPDGTKVLLSLLYHDERKIVVCDLRTDTLQIIPIRWPKGSGYNSPCWWQSDDVIGYISPYTGQRVLVKLGKE